MTQEEQRCAFGATDALRRAMRRRMIAGELVSPYRNVYASAEYWHTLNEHERQRHLIRALSKMHPGWVFTAESAACMYGLEHSYTLHDKGVQIASLLTGRRQDSQLLDRIYMRTIPLCDRGDVPLVTPERMLIDCAERLPFTAALPIFDSALRQELTTVQKVQHQLDSDSGRFEQTAAVLGAANLASENGGESLMRGLIDEARFAAPLLQIEFDNPSNPQMPYRVDFCWKLADGRIIVAEYDGIAKYADASNASRASIKAKLAYERNREKNLKTQGVTAIVHVFYEDLMTPRQLVGKLLEAGVPRLI